VCSSGTCRSCGSRGQPCCNGSSCFIGVCQSGTCQ
jgi:hypothetical protein